VPKFQLNTEEHLLMDFFLSKKNPGNQKESTCTFYAEKYILVHRKKMIEKTHSAIQKAILFPNDVYTELITIIEDSDKDKVYAYLQNTKIYLSKHPTAEPHSLAVLNELTLLLNIFQKPIDPEKAITWLKKRWDEKEKEAIQPLFYVSLDELWNKVEGNFEKRAFYQLCWHKKRRDDRRISASLWHPSDGLLALLKEMKQNGPLIAGGYFGSYFYQTPPVRIGSIAHYILYQFLSSTHQKFRHHSLHFIALVGGHKKNKWLYYLDPNNQYEKNLSNRLFVISYDSLVEQYQNPYGITEGDLTEQGIKPDRYLLKLSSHSLFAIKHYEKKDFSYEIQTLLKATFVNF